MTMKDFYVQNSEQTRFDPEKISKLASEHDFLSVHRPISQIQDAMNRLQSKRRAEQISVDLLQRQVLLDSLHQRITKSQDEINDRYQRISSLQTQIHSANAISEIIKRRTTVAELDRRLVSEREALEKATWQNRSDRDEFDIIESELSRLRVSHERIIGDHTDNFQSEQIFADNRAAIVKALLLKTEHKKEKKKLKRAKKARMRTQMMQEIERQEQSQVDLSNEHHHKALQRLHLSQTVIDEARTVIKEEQERRKRKYNKNILQLKESIESSLQEINRHPPRARNPEEERQRENQRKEVEMKVREMEITSRLLREHGEDVKLENNHHKAATEKIHWELQKQANQQGVIQMQQPNFSDKEIYPSQIADVKTRSFGSGRAPDRVVERIRRKHQEVVVETRQRSQLSLPKASQKDIRRIEAAVQRRQTELNEGSTKSVCGREPYGAYFISDPSKIQFQDYTLGETPVVSRFTLKNVSYCENAFKFRGVQDAIFKEFFDIQYERRGRMSPGMGVHVTVLFHGDVREDLYTNMEFVSEIGGTFLIPVEIHVPKSNISLSSTSLNFGRVVTGKTKQLAVQITNHGALSASMSMSFHERDQTVFEIINDPVTIAGYSTADLHLRYHPSVAAAQHRDTLTLSLANSSDQWTSPKSFSIEMIGYSDDVPLFVNRHQIEFGCCQIGDIYRDTVLISNRSSGLVRFAVSLPNINGLSIHPLHGLLPGFEDTSIYIQLQPSAQALQTYMVQEKFSIPIKIIPDDQEMIKICLSGLLTNADVEVDQNCIYFGYCYVGQSVYQEIIVRNTSLVMQRYGFVSDDLQVSAVPNTIHILPQDEAKIRLVYAPRKPKTVLKSKIEIITNLGRCRCIKCKGSSMKAPLEFSMSTVIMGSCGPGVSLYKTVHVQNKLQNDRFVQISVSVEDQKNIKFSPDIFQIASGETVPVDVLFSASREYDSNESQQTDLRSVFVDVQNQTKMFNYVIPVFTRSSEANNSDQYQTLFLQVQAQTIEPQLKMLDSNNKLEFGEVPIGQNKVIEVLLSNRSENSCPLTLISSKLVSSAFEVLSPSPVPKVIDSGQTITFSVKFSPSSNCKYYEKMYISNQMVIELIGTGAPLIIVLEPNDDVIDFGDVLTGDTQNVSVKLDNRSNFAITFETKSTVPSSSSKDGMLSITPTSQRVESKESTSLVLVLQPGSIPNFEGEISLEVAACSFVRKLQVKARPRSRQLFFNLPGCDDQIMAILASPTPYQIPLHIYQEEAHGAAIKARFLFGCCKIENLPYKSAPGSWEITLSETAKKGGYLKVSMATGKLAPGESIPIEIQFDCQNWAAIYDPINVICEIKEPLQCTLQGGWAPPEQPPNIKFDIILHFHLRPKLNIA